MLRAFIIPDKTRVGWWKNGYPEYFAKVINAANWIGIDILIDGEQLDLAKCEVSEFLARTEYESEGYLKRSFSAKTAQGKIVKVEAVSAFAAWPMMNPAL